MTKVLQSKGEKTNVDESPSRTSSRRSFIKLSSAAVLTAFAFGALKPETLRAKDAYLGLPVEPAQAAVDLGKGDTGVLNYAYALEQLEAAFYTQALTQPYANMSGLENRS